MHLTNGAGFNVNSRRTVVETTTNGSNGINGIIGTSGVVDMGLDSRMASSTKTQNCKF